MSDCPSIQTCPFFNDQLANRPAMSNVLKKSYCNGNYAGCARYMVSQRLGSTKVPANLFPNMGDRARELVAVG